MSTAHAEGPLTYTVMALQISALDMLRWIKKEELTLAKCRNHWSRHAACRAVNNWLVHGAGSAQHCECIKIYNLQL